MFRAGVCQACSCLDRSLWDHVLLCKGQAKPRVTVCSYQDVSSQYGGCKLELSAACFKSECFSFKCHQRTPFGFYLEELCATWFENSWHLGISEEAFFFKIIFHLRLFCVTGFYSHQSLPPLQCIVQGGNLRVCWGRNKRQSGVRSRTCPNPPSEGNTILPNTNYTVCTLKRKGPKVVSLRT